MSSKSNHQHRHDDRSEEAASYETDKILPAANNMQSRKSIERKVNSKSPIHTAREEGSKIPLFRKGSDTNLSYGQQVRFWLKFAKICILSFKRN